MIKKFLRWIQKPWLLDRPYALQLHEWKELDEEQKEKYPIRFFLQQTLPLTLSCWYHWYIQNPIWRFKYTYVKKHQYNIIRLRELKAGYYDADQRILYACFQELCDHWERVLKRRREYGDRDANDPNDNPLSEEELLMEKIYHYWKVERVKLIEKEEGLPEESLCNEIREKYGSTSYIFDKTKQDCPLIKKWKKQSEQSRKLEIKIRKLDDKHLRNIIKIREYLWS